jgi:hypothetical protein
LDRLVRVVIPVELCIENNVDDYVSGIKGFVLVGLGFLDKRNIKRRPVKTFLHVFQIDWISMVFRKYQVTNRIDDSLHLSFDSSFHGLKLVHFDKNLSPLGNHLSATGYFSFFPDWVYCRVSFTHIHIRIFFHLVLNIIAAGPTLPILLHKPAIPAHRKITFKEN